MACNDVSVVASVKGDDFMSTNDTPKGFEALRKEWEQEMTTRIAKLKDLPPTKFNRGDKVRFTCGDDEVIGIIEIVDFGGSFEHDYHSYDILTEDGLCKHVPEEVCRIVE